MPHRRIKFEDGKVLVERTDAAEYHGKEMSDGERIALYLIGQCLCVPDHSIIIVDTPEMHLHKSLVRISGTKLRNSARRRQSFTSPIPGFCIISSGPQPDLGQGYPGDGARTRADVPSTAPYPKSRFVEVIGSQKSFRFSEGGLAVLMQQFIKLRIPNITSFRSAAGKK